MGIERKKRKLEIKRTMIQPWNSSKYMFFMMKICYLRVINGSLTLNVFDCVLLEIGKKTNTCPEWSNGCEYSHIDLCIPGFDNFMYSTAKMCDTNEIMAEQSSVNGEWYNFYDSLIETKQNCKLLPIKTPFFITYLVIIHLLIISFEARMFFHDIHLKLEYLLISDTYLSKYYVRQIYIFFSFRRNHSME